MNGVEILTDHPTTDVGANGIMKALVYHGPGQRKWETKPEPTIRERGDAIVRIFCTQPLHTSAGGRAAR